MPPLRDPAAPKVRVKAKPKPVQQYAALPVAARQSQLASKGVLAPKYGKAIKAEHAKRVTQLATDPAARGRLAKRQVVQALQAAKPPTARLTPVKPKGGGLATITGDAASAVGGLAAKGAMALITPPKHAKGGDFIRKTIRNIPKDAAELAVTTPSSIAKLASTAVHDPEKVPGMLLEPYKQLVKHPGDFISEHPVSTALMVAPAVKVPGRAVGRVARVTGKQTLRRPDATLPGAALRQQRVGSRDVVVRAVQARKDRKAGAPTMTPREVARRVDESYAVGKLHTNRVLSSAARRAQAKAAQLPEAQRAEHVAKQMEGAKKGAQRQVRRKFVEEFGATAQPIVPGGRGIVRPKVAAKGVVHSTREDAQVVADRMPFEASVVRVGKQQFGVVPKDAFERLRHHESIGKSKATGAKILKVGGQQFRATVLPFSPRWLAGQGVEAGFRSAVAGAGPASFVKARRVVKEMNRQAPGSGDALLSRTVPGGVFGLSGTAREFAYGQRTLADQFERTALHKPAKGLTAAAAQPGIRHVRAGFRKYSEFVFNQVNGKMEQVAQTAMLGKAIKRSPVMERRIVGLSDKAIEDAAKGLHGTEAQVALGRAVDRGYGRYNKFGPETREALLHWTPFLPWSVNVVNFLTRVLPNDHPVLASLTASVDAATEEWRKKNGLSLRGGGTRPGFLLGGYPVGKGDSVLPISRYLPFVPGGNVFNTAGNLLLPQYSGIGKNLFLGLDWKDKPLKGDRLLNVLTTAAETFVPGTAQAGRATGITGRYVRKTGEPSVFQGKNVKEDVLRELNPFKASKSRSATGKSGQVGKIVLPKGGIKIGKIVLPKGF